MSTGSDGTKEPAPDGVAAVVLDGDGTVVCWSRSATGLLGYTAQEAGGQPFRRLLKWDDGPGAATGDGPVPSSGPIRLRHRSGNPVDITVLALPFAASTDVLLVLSPTAEVAALSQGAGLLRSLLAQDRLGIAIFDRNLTVVRSNITPGMFDGPPVNRGDHLSAVLPPRHAARAETVLRRVLETGVPEVGLEWRISRPGQARRERELSVYAIRLEGPDGRPAGVIVAFTDATEERRSRRQLELLHEATARIGGSLDVTRTAQQLADVLVPTFGDLVAVDLVKAVLTGDEPPRLRGGVTQRLRRAAVASATGIWPPGLLEAGELSPALPESPNLRRVWSGQTIITDREGAVEPLVDPRLVDLYVPKDGESLVSAPLTARGGLLGAVMVWRTEGAAPFDERDAELLAAIASRAALSLDNARRYAREHSAAYTLQQRLLPPPLVHTAAAETAGIYLPASGGADISGDWYDVLPLPSLRTAFVVGDVIGHGLHASATMGRLRTAIQTLADLELDPTELLTRLDDLVQRLATESTGQRDTIGASCLYIVYDPVTGCCTLASAGHPAPLVILPDGTTRPLPISPGPSLGVGGMPFESTTADLPPGSVLALYTDGLIRDGEDLDEDGTPRALRTRLAAEYQPDRPLERIGHDTVVALAGPAPRDDVALLLARIHALPAEDAAQWTFPADPQAVPTARRATARQLAAWGLDELSFAVELVVSELVTNAVRHAGGPLTLRLLRERVLVVEVTDPSNTQPRLRRATSTDENGRGLFLVAQLSDRWGSRYGQRGKTIWAEHALQPRDQR